MGVGGIEAPPATTGEGLSLRLRGGARGEGEGSAEGARGEAGEAGEAAEGAGTAESTHGVFTNAGRTARRNYTQHQWGLLGGHGGYLDNAIHTLDVEAGRVPARRGHDAFALVPTQSGATVGVSWVECAACEPSGEPPPPPPEAPVLPPYWHGHEPPAPMQVEPALPAAVPPAVHPPLVPVPATCWNVGRIQPDTHLSPDIASTLTIMSARMKVGCALYLYDFPPKVHDTPQRLDQGQASAAVGWETRLRVRAARNRSWETLAAGTARQPGPVDHEHGSHHALGAYSGADAARGTHRSQPAGDAAGSRGQPRSTLPAEPSQPGRAGSRVGAGITGIGRRGEDQVTVGARPHTTRATR